MYGSPSICSRRSAASTLTHKKKTNHHVFSSSSMFTSDSLSQHLSCTCKPSHLAPVSPASQGRFQSLVSKAFGAESHGRGELHNVQRDGRRGGPGGGRGGGRAGRMSRGRGSTTEQLDNRDPGRGLGRASRRGGRAGRGRGGFHGGDESSEEEVPALEVCIQDAANASRLPPKSMALCMLTLARRVNLDKRGGARYSSSECAAGVDAARKLMGQLLGSSSSSGTPASTDRPPALQLSTVRLSQHAWSLSVMVGFDESLSAPAQQLCYALA
ncbi:hypothetical protein DUNSADRAFT_350 [Dunaliella salina]|uniref:Encoded protein n=1 Tax=Dunaliella salina TaxID=3046 RepID=A0ABQ7FZ26_DUNSA|nr:hypothetical protein DUNSADRAFT_350 [Dunaliella salina]|eukprot:KAF5827612.1 hypothetical protein DUNSADRAFT_350 [Dunaliella salina]